MHYFTYLRLGQAQRRLRRANEQDEDGDDQVQIAFVIPEAINNQLLD